MRGERTNCLLLSGLCLGFALATKYTFAPAVIAFTVAIAILTMEGRWPRLRSLLLAFCSRELWFLVSGIILGFLLVTGFFIATSPHEFLAQTVLSQLDYRVGGTLHAVVSRILRFPGGGLFDTISTLCLFVSILVLVTLLIKRDYCRRNRFLLTGLLVSLPICASFKAFGEMRYFVSAFIFTLLTIAAFTPAMDAKMLSSRLTVQTIRSNVGFIAILLLLLVFTSGVLVLYRGYGYTGSGGPTYEEWVYKETVDYLEQVGAKRVYAANPIIPALSPKLSSTLEFDTFGLLFPMKQLPETIVKERLAEGVDYMVLDAFVRYFAFTSEIGQLVQEIQKNGTFVKAIVPEVPVLGVAIYAVPSP